jgi:hypothetical protein
MKYNKFLTITLVSLLLFTSISAVSMARISTEEVKNITINGTTKGLISNFLNKLQEVFPVLAKFFKNLKPAEPSTPDTDTCPKLLFDISVGARFTLEEQIIVEATLANIGRNTIRLCEMNFKVGTLDYFISAPDGYELHYVGLVDAKQVQIWTLLPKESRSIDIDIKCGSFNVLPYLDGDSLLCKPYEFIPGDYAIYGIYNSFLPEDSLTSAVNNIWQGTLKTEAHYFTIIK